MNTATPVNGLNQIVTVGGAATTHDARGNLTFDPAGARTSGYNSLNQLPRGARDLCLR